MTRWRYFAERLHGDGTSTLLDADLPLTDVEITDALSAPGGMSGKISPRYARLLGPDGRPTLSAKWDTAVYAERDGEIRGGGIIDSSKFSGETWNIEAMGFLGYLNDMPYTGIGQHFVDVDSLDIARAIMDHVQSQPGGNLGITLDQKKSGVRVGSRLAAPEYDPEGGDDGLTLQANPYKLRWYEDLDLSSNFNGLAQDTPFDYHFRMHWGDADEIVRHVDFGVPKLGTKRRDLRFSYGENVRLAPEVDNDGAEYASEVYLLGAGEGARMVRGYARHPRSGLRRPVVISDPSVRKLPRANRMARRELAWRKELDDISSIEVADTPSAPIGSVAPGDEIYISGDTGWVTLDAWFRVMAITTKPASNVMTLDVLRSDRVDS